MVSTHHHQNWQIRLAILVLLHIDMQHLFPDMPCRMNRLHVRKMDFQRHRQFWVQVAHISFYIYKTQISVSSNKKIMFPGPNFLASDFWELHAQQALEISKGKRVWVGDPDVHSSTKPMLAHSEHTAALQTVQVRLICHFLRGNLGSHPLLYSHTPIPLEWARHTILPCQSQEILRNIL